MLEQHMSSLSLKLDDEPFSRSFLAQQKTQDQVVSGPFRVGPSLL